MPTPEQTLTDYRARIDALDESIARLLIERVGVIRQVAALKAEHWPKACHIRPGREGKMHRAIADRFRGTGFPARMALAIWRQLIGGSTHLESPLNIVYLAAHPEHRFLAREYFGVQIGATAVDSLAHALATLKSGQSNILVLPAPHHADWPHHAAALRDAGLSIFAALPVEADNLPENCTAAVALAALSPEDSGDDISYFIRADGTLETLDGFHTTRDGALFLGAHPRPISLHSGVMYA